MLLVSHGLLVSSGNVGISSFEFWSQSTTDMHPKVSKVWEIEDVEGSTFHPKLRKLKTITIGNVQKESKKKS